MKLERNQFSHYLISEETLNEVVTISKNTDKSIFDLLKHKVVYCVEKDFSISTFILVKRFGTEIIEAWNKDDFYEIESTDVFFTDLEEARAFCDMCKTNQDKFSLDKNETAPIYNILTQYFNEDGSLVGSHIVSYTIKYTAINDFNDLFSADKECTYYSNVVKEENGKYSYFDNSCGLKCVVSLISSLLSN